MPESPRNHLLPTASAFALVALCLCLPLPPAATVTRAGGLPLGRQDTRTPLHLAARDGDIEAARRLLAGGADIDARANGAHTPLMAAAAYGELEMVRFLLAQGADPSLRDADGRTAAERARQNGHAALVGVLESIPSNRAGTAAGRQQGERADSAQAAAEEPAPRDTTPGRTDAAEPRQRQQRRGAGAPTDDEIRATLEKSFTTVYQNHFYGVKNPVTFEWVGPITVGAPETRGRIPTRCHPAKLNVKVTAEDPRDGNRSTVARGTEANIGGFAKTEIFCFSRDGFGEWKYVTYEP
jgi:hypothetical protein